MWIEAGLMLVVGMLSYAFMRGSLALMVAIALLIVGEFLTHWLGVWASGGFLVGYGLMAILLQKRSSSGDWDVFDSGSDGDCSSD